MKQIELTRLHHRHIFRYESGDEQTVIEALVSNVRRPDLRFDWFDAAVLSHQLGKTAEATFKTIAAEKDGSL